MPLRYVFIDFDSFFAAVEQQVHPRLRGEPVGIVPSLGVRTTCCIAASYEAKAKGVKTGTGVDEARRLCPGIRFVEADHRRYVKMHHRIKETVEKLLHIEEVVSIDELYGVLPENKREVKAVRQLASAIKVALAETVGPWVSASIGVAPNRFLAKITSKMNKPNGMKIVQRRDLPDVLFGLELEDIHGVGKRMDARLRRAGIRSVEALCRAPRRQLRNIWGSVEGERLFWKLQGADFPELETTRRTVGHSHVLAPENRTQERAHAILHYLLHKACRRLRAMDYYTERLTVSVKFDFTWRWTEEASCFPTQDSVALARVLNRLWARRPRGRGQPCKASIVLTHLTHASQHSASLFEEDNAPRRVKLQRTMDQLNVKYGGRSVYYACAWGARMKGAAPMRISFTQIPDLDLERDE